MKRFLAAVFVFASLIWAIDVSARFPRGTPALSNPNLRQENVFGLTGSAWQTFAGSYTPGLGNPAVSTADWYHQGGVAWMRPTDLTSAACVAAGATTTNGRYVWVSSVDHPSSNFSWTTEQGFRLGYSNDPGVLPDTMRVVYQGSPYTVSPTVQTATITASISSNSLIVSAVAGQVTFSGAGTVSGAGMTSAAITAFVSGTMGGVGTYTINGAPQTVGSQSMTISQSGYFIYQNPYFVCNPDDVSFPFMISAEGQGSAIEHEQGYIKSADLVMWSAAAPSHIVWTFGSFGGWSSFQRPVRDGASSWHSTGFAFYYTATNTAGLGKWTSTDGYVWTPPTSLFNVCIPSNSPGFDAACGSGTTMPAGLGAVPDRVTIAAQDWALARLDTNISGTRTGQQWVGRAPIDANFNVLSSPAVVKVSAAYAGIYPSSSFLQTTGAYIEDGVAYYFGSTGFPTSDAQFGTVNGATYANGGGLWQQGLDIYTEIIDAAAAAGAAPAGVKATCANSVATLTWFDSLPQQTRRLYRGTSAGSQPTLVGDFTGTTATDSGMTLNAVSYYKLVYLHSGVEQKNRVVSTWCSSDSQFVNAHYTRASAGGADMTTCNRTMINAFDGWLVSNSLSNNLLFATMADFCVAKSGSVISKIFDMGTTRFPRGGDYTPQTVNTAYNATGINSKPAWVNAANAGGYYGSGNLNNIRRKTQITVFAAYQKPGTAQFVPLVFGEGTNSRMMLAHTAGTPGAVNFYLTDATQNKTATATITGLATDVHTIAGTYSSVNGAIAYADAVAGTPQTGLVIPSPNLNPPDILTGQIGTPNDVFTLGSGNDFGRYRISTSAYFFNGSYAQSSVRAQMVFDKELTGAQITSLDALVR